MIWMYDKESGLAKHLPIKAVAQQPNYYEAEIERSLNDQVETPARTALESLSKASSSQETSAYGSLSISRQCICAVLADAVRRMDLFPRFSRPLSTVFVPS